MATHPHTLAGDNLSFSYPEAQEPLFSEVCFRLCLDGTAPSRVGLIGPNGHGKSTFLSLLHRQRLPDQGALTEAGGQASIGVLYQHLSAEDAMRPLGDFLQDGNTEISSLSRRLQSLEEAMADAQGEVLESLLDRYSKAQTRFLTLGGYDWPQRFEETRSALELDSISPTRLMSSLSCGQQLRASLARLLLQPHDLLLLDEPTNHLDQDAIQWLQRFLLDIRGAYVVVSHDRDFLDQVSEETWMLEEGELVCAPLCVSDFLAEREAEAQRRRQAYAVQQKEIKRLQKSARQRMGWAHRREKDKFGPGVMDRGFIGATAARQAKRAKHALRRIEQEIETRKQALPDVAPEIMLRFEVKGPLPPQIVRAHRLAVERGGQQLWSELSFELLPGACLAFAGPNGCGKSTLLEILAGTIQPMSGNCKIHPQASVAVLPQDIAREIDKISPEQRLIDVIGASHLDAQARTLLAILGFPRDAALRPCRGLSPGEWVRVLLARTLLTGASLLLLDEPTNHLDLPAREALADALAVFEGAIACVSHDQAFLRQINAQIISLPEFSPHVSSSLSLNSQHPPQTSG